MTCGPAYAFNIKKYNIYHIGTSLYLETTDFVLFCMRHTLNMPHAQIFPVKAISGLHTHMLPYKLLILDRKKKHKSILSLCNQRNKNLNLSILRQYLK